MIKQNNIQEEMKNILNKESFIDFIYGLKYRWRDERGYEDWKEYEDSIKRIFKTENLNVYKITKTFNIYFVNETTGNKFLIKFGQNRLNICYIK